MINKLLKKELIFSNVEVPGNTKEEALKVITNLCKNYTNLDSKELYDAFMERENMDSTGFGEGFAIPHAKINNLKQAFIVIARFKEDIEWESIDDEPVNVAIGLIMPAGDKDNLHVQVLAKFSRKLMNEEFTAKLRNEKDTEELYQYIVKVIEE